MIKKENQFFCKLSNAHKAHNEFWFWYYFILYWYYKHTTWKDTFMINWTPTTAYNYTYFSLYCLYITWSLYIFLYNILCPVLLHTWRRTGTNGERFVLLLPCAIKFVSEFLLRVPWKWKSYRYAQLYDVRGNNLVIVVH